MPSSFSRFLSDEELRKVRDLYLKSLEQEGLEGPQPDGEGSSGTEGARPAETVSRSDDSR